MKKHKDRWAYIVDPLDASKGGLWAAGRLVIRLETAGPGHTVDTGALMAQALNDHEDRIAPR